VLGDDFGDGAGNGFVVRDVTVVGGYFGVSVYDCQLSCVAAIGGGWVLLVDARVFHPEMPDELLGLAGTFVLCGNWISSARLIACKVLTVQIHKSNIGSTQQTRLGHDQAQPPCTSSHDSHFAIEGEIRKGSFEMHAPAPLYRLAGRVLMFFGMVDLDRIICPGETSLVVVMGFEGTLSNSRSALVFLVKLRRAGDWAHGVYRLGGVRSCDT